MTPLFSQIRPLFALLLLPLPSAWAELDIPALEKLEKQMQVVTEKAMPSVVGLNGRKAGGPPFTGTGIVIGKNGLILTAGHMVEGGVESLEVVFLDGKKFQAKVLGADHGNDVALAMITEPGTYPFIEMRDSKDLAAGEVLLSLGHTAGLDFKRKAPLRFGRFFEITRRGELRSDCLMSGGDSGGPLLDLNGKVVGVHSHINPGMSDNFDVPTSIVLKNWDRMVTGERLGEKQRSTTPRRAAQTLTAEELAGLDLKKFSEQVAEARKTSGGKLSENPADIAKWCRESGMKEDRLKSMSDGDLLAFFRKALSASEKVAAQPTRPAQPAQPAARPASPGDSAVAQQDKEIQAAVKPTLEKLVPSVVSLTDGKKTLALGTIVRANGFILTKHSEIAKAPEGLKARLSDGRELSATKVREFPEYDLALVKVAADSLPAVTFPERQDPLSLGKFVFTPGTQADKALLESGVVGVQNRIIPGRGFMGVSLGEGKDCVELTDVSPNGPAAKAGLQKGDQVLSIGNQTFKKSQELSQHIRTSKPGSKLQLKYRRAGEEKTAEIQLERPQVDANQKPVRSTATLGAEISDVAIGFPMAFQHDQTLRASECGSVLVDLQGAIAGVNIARTGRTYTYAIPAPAVAELLKAVDFDALAKQVATQ